jgi:hypothetical protein
MRKEYKSVENVAIDVVCGHKHRLIRGKLVDHVNDGVLVEYKWFGQKIIIGVPENIAQECPEEIEGLRLFGVSEGKFVAHPLGVCKDDRINYTVGEISQLVKARVSIELSKSCKSSSGSDMLKIVLIIAAIAGIAFLIYSKMNGSSDDTVTTMTTEAVRVISGMVGGNYGG